MTHFVDGPAAGVRLELARAPVFLRAVRDAAGKWDALDLLTDTPRPGETVAVYRKAADDGSAHISYTDRATGRRRGKWLRFATYRVVGDQPGEAVTRDTAAWRAWCLAEVAKPTGASS